MAADLFLGKNGKAHGPFTAQEFEALQADGSISQYQYIWSAKSEAWEPLHAAPPPLTVSSSRKKRGSKSAPQAGYHGVCHDRRRIVAGMIENVTQIGCDLITEKGAVRGPAFPMNSVLFLNLLDPGSGESINVRATLSKTHRREDSTWVLRLKWDEPPAIL